MKTHPPVVGIVADFRILNHHPFHCIGNKYVQAVAEASEVLPLLIPALADKSDFDAILDLVDGLLFTGSPSNVAPRQYGTTLAADHLADDLDEQRDATTLPLIRQAIQRGVPVLGLCRGMQEINVALGGSLHQEVHRVDGFLDHREPDDADLDVQYAPSHPVTFAAGGKLIAITGLDHAEVNSLHGQGVDRLAPGLSVEARAPDGLVEAFSVDGATTFALAVQWHPEWRFEINPVSQSIFRAFGASCRERAEQKARLEHARTPSQSQRSDALRRV